LSILTPLRNRFSNKNATALVDITANEPEQSAEAHSSLVLRKPLSFKFYHQCGNVRTIIQSLWVSWTNGNSMSNFDNGLQHTRAHARALTRTHAHTHKQIYIYRCSIYIYDLQ
jgi:hypothetical protein